MHIEELQKEIGSLEMNLKNKESCLVEVRIYITIPSSVSYTYMYSIERCDA